MIQKNAIKVNTKLTFYAIIIYIMEAVDKIIRTNGHSMMIQVTNLGEVIVKAPLNFSNDKIDKFINQKYEWIVKCKSRAIEIVKANEDIVNYKKCLFLGKIYSLIPYNTKEIAEYNDNLLIPNNKDTIKTLKLWYKKIGKDILTSRLDYFCKLLKVSYSSLKIDSARTKWGSCNTKKVISINFRALMLTTDCIDYIILHEVCHLKEFNHSLKFWLLVESVMPNYEKEKSLIKKSAFLLNLY
jgi:predicted metal-dependent hydrolase